MQFAHKGRKRKRDVRTCRKSQQLLSFPDAKTFIPKKEYQVNFLTLFLHSVQYIEHGNIVVYRGQKKTMSSNGIDFIPLDSTLN